MANKQTINELSSGYKSGIAQWDRLLKCWNSRLRINSDLTEISILKFADKSELEARNNRSSKFELPTTYLDFHRAYANAGGLFRSRSKGNEYGLFHPSDVQMLISFYPGMIESLSEYPIEASDASYYVYGVDQMDCNIRTSYLKDALVIGQYGFDPSELILFYPNSVTSDGEFETSCCTHTGEFRTTSFAEMMRHMTMYMLNEKDGVMPPYSETKLQKSCAKYLDLSPSSV